jgi:hypothetical protein
LTRPRMLILVSAAAIGLALSVPAAAPGSSLRRGNDVAAGASAQLGCPSHSNPQRIKLWIHVTQWCALHAVRGQAQFKLQMRIHNQSTRHRLDIGLSRMRLIVRVFHRDKWTPPRVGEATTERPVRTIYAGERVWAVPPNAENAFDFLPHRRGVGTFATHWGGSVLGPGETFNPDFHYGDLVFYVPAPHDGEGALDNVVGMAYVRGHEIIALCRPQDWGPKVRAETFLMPTTIPRR